MAFTRVNPLGWALFEELTSAQMNQLDLNASRAIDGTFGGTYNPSNPININGTMTVTNINVGTLTGNGVFTSLYVSGQSDFHGIVYHHNNTYLQGVTYIQALVNMTAGEFRFEAAAGFNILNGVFHVVGPATAIFDADTTFGAGVDVVSNANWTFSGGTVTYGPGPAVYVNTFWRFLNRPQFGDGLQLDAGELIHYATSQSWTVRCPFAVGGGPNPDSGAYRFDSGGYWYQYDSSTWPRRLWCYPQGLWGGVAVEITAAEFRARGNGLSGTPSGDTEYRLFVTGQDFTGSTTVTAVDGSPNSASDHSASWSGTLAYDPTNQMLGAVFMGYRGGDTLNGSSKWYEIKSMRLTLRTNSKGRY